MSNLFRECADGILLHIRVTPRASANALGDIRDGVLQVKVTAAPDRGKANEAIAKLLAKQLSLPPSSIEVLAGATSRNKLILLRSAKLEDLPSWGES